jgi:hypothetical protein
MSIPASSPGQRIFLSGTSGSVLFQGSGLMTLTRCWPGSGEKIKQSGENAGIVGIFISVEEAAGSVPLPVVVIFQPKIRSVLLKMMMKPA